MQRILGYILLTVGLLLIAGPLLQTYLIFTGSAQPPHVFTVPAPVAPDPAASQFDIQKQMQNALLAILPIELFTNVLNLSSWIMLMFILMFGGKLLAEIGVKLLKVYQYDEE